MTAIIQKNSMRWEHHFQRRGTGFSAFWKEYLSRSDKKILFIIGLGFDPRMCSGIKTIIKQTSSQNQMVCDCTLIEYSKSNEPQKKYSDRINKNKADIRNIIDNHGTIYEKKIKMERDGKSIADRSAGQIFSNIIQIQDYTDIVIDISAMPKNIFFPLIAKLLYLLDDAKMNNHLNLPNLHITVAENVNLDNKITDSGLKDTDVRYIHPFTEGTRAATSEIPCLWIPILGESQNAQLEILTRGLPQNEVCPVLPSPSANPRRVDELIIEYRELLFERLAIEPQNFIYAAEQDPFEAYKQIFTTVMRYDAALKKLGGCKTILSPVSSKILSLGALLAAYELMSNKFIVSVTHLEKDDYKLDLEENEIAILSQQEELFSLWLFGECYEP